MFDSLTIAAVADEINRRACPAKIQRVLALSPLALGLELYSTNGRLPLVLSAHTDNARVHLSDQPLTRDPAIGDAQLLLLLRKYVRGGRLLSVAQPDLERVLLFSIAKIMPLGKTDDIYYTQAVNPSDDKEDAEDETTIGEEVHTQLVVEMMGRHSNIILLDSAGNIMDSLKRVPASINRYRTVLPHQRYVAPPAQEKLRFSDLDRASFAQRIAAAIPAEGKKGGQLWQSLVAVLLGTSPQMAREIVYRATAAADTAAANFSDWPTLYAATTELFDLAETGHWQPCVVYESMAADDSELPALGIGEGVGEAGEERAIAFAAYHLRHLEGANRQLLATASISAAVEAYFHDVEQTAAHEQLKEQLRARIATRRTKIASRLHSLREQLARAATTELLRYKGEMIFAYQYNIIPASTSLSVPAADGAGEIDIALDPQLSVVENAQRYFRDYHKAQAAGAELPTKVAANEQQLAYLDEMEQMIDAAQGYDDITLTARELADLDKPATPPKPSKQKPGKQKPGLPSGLGKLLRVISPDGLEVYVGKSMRQNDYLALKLAAPDDIWLHARGVPGAHVVIKMHNLGEVPNRSLLYAAALAAGRSQARHNTAVEVMYTQARYLRKPPGAPPGSLTYSHEKSVRVQPILPDEA